MGMSGHESASPLRACVKIADYCDPSYTDTLTHVKSLVMVLRAFCHCIHVIRNSRSFILFW
jgi:hypothetical protein